MVDYYDGGSSRYERALAQRMYLLQATRVGEQQWEFQIEGSRGVPYSIYMSNQKSKCTCPDFMRRRATCKHIIFISTRVLRMADYSSRLTPEMDQALSNLLLKPSSTNQEQAVTDALLEDSEDSAKKPLEGACPICFDDFEPSDAERYEWCHTCKNPIHTKCLQIWLRQKNTCPLCRSRWERKPAKLAISDGAGNDALAKFDAVSASSSSASSTQAVPAPRQPAASGASSSSRADSGLERITVTTAKKQYGVKEEDLVGLDCLFAANPMYSRGPAMRLYRVADIKAAARRRAERETSIQRAKEEEKAAELRAKEAAKQAKAQAKQAAIDAKQAAKEAKARMKQAENEAKQAAKRAENEAKQAAKQAAKDAEEKVNAELAAKLKAEKEAKTGSRANAADSRSQQATVEAKLDPQQSEGINPRPSAESPAGPAPTSTVEEALSAEGLRRSKRRRTAKSWA